MVFAAFFFQPPVAYNSYFHAMRLSSLSSCVLLAACSLLTLSASDAEAAGRRPAKSKKTAVTAPAVVQPTAREARAYQAAWAEAMRDYRRGDFRGAVVELEKLGKTKKGAGSDPLAELYRTVVTGQAWWRARDTARAELALTAALALPAASDAAWQRYLHRMKMRFQSERAPVSATSARKDYLLSVTRASVENTDKAEAYYRLLALDTDNVSGVITPAERAAWARQLIALAVPGARFEREYRRWVASTLVDSAAAQSNSAATVVDTTRETQRLLLDWEEKLGLWEQAIARAAALAARDTGSERARETARSLQLRIAQWYYNAGGYDKATAEYLRIRERFGDSPEVLMQLARSYRALGQDGPAQAWYTRLVERYPKDGRSAEVLWMRAFDDEMTGKVDTALGAYARIARDFPQHVRSGEAMFRSGLIQFRSKDYAAAQKSFTDLRLARKSGRLTGAAHYWEGKAFVARGQDSAAHAAWAALTRDYPFGHYGHLARRDLTARGALPDSLTWPRQLNTATGDGIRNWFYTSGRLPASARGASDTVASGPRDTIGLPASARGTQSPSASALAESFAPRFGESAWLPVEKLVELELDTLAVLTLQARVNSAPTNLWLIYDAAIRCRTAGFGYEAYRFAVRLSDRLPLEQWPYAPVEVLRLFYPPSYIELVRPEARRAGIPAALALALIKQESGFDPGAVSRVGARGLMQLMPATGAEQARKEGFKGFHADSLFVPAVNIRLGVAYLRDVLKRHDGNIDWALAHYNAGPTALARWMPRLENRPAEEAVEDIGYAETREYVKRVGANYKTYQVLWDGK